MSTLLAGQIAAGEVVERPASVVKELVENALDAGAARITVDLEQGGIELVRVTDDGGGIHPDDLPLALAPHATSKITAAEDLDRIATFGFRGEALASICSVARVSIRSRQPGSDAAWQIDGEGDRISEVRPASGATGTSVSVRTLFFNTPARRKFLRTVTTEQTRCVDVMRDLAMGSPGVAFTVTCDGRTVIDVPPNQSPRERAIDLLGQELESQLLEVSADEFDSRVPATDGARAISMWGLVGRPSIARATNKAQHVFLNGRPIRDRTIQHAISEAYRGIIEPGRYPTAVLLLEMAPSSVDVNVHPAKAEVRFRDGSLVHSVVIAAIRRSLRAADLTPTIAAIAHQGAARHELPPIAGAQAIQPTAGAGIGAVTGAGAGGASPASSRSSAAAFAAFFNRPTSSGTHAALSYAEIKRTLDQAAAPPPPAEAPASAAGAPSIQPVSHAVTDPAEPAATLGTPMPATRILQVHNSYLVTQDEQGVLIIDQHALHERAMFEHLLARVQLGDLESQALLAPIAVEVTAAQVDLLPALEPLFARIGVSAAALGPRTVGVHAFPTFLFSRGVEPAELIRELLERAEADGFAPTSEQAMRDVLDMMACKAAVKAGDHMSEPELAHLVQLREAVERASNCPHGRPTSIRLTIRELEKLFGRS